MIPVDSPVGCEKCGEWKLGPLQEGTYNWGAVRLHEQDKNSAGMYYADFCGDHVMIEYWEDGKMSMRRVEPWEIKWYNNCLDLPPRD